MADEPEGAASVEANRLRSRYDISLCSVQATIWGAEQVDTMPVS